MSFGDFFSGIGDTISIAFDWLNNSENARAADFISGAALAGIEYVAAQDKQKADRELVELQERRADDRKKVWHKKGSPMAGVEALDPESGRGERHRRESRSNYFVQGM